MTLAKSAANQLLRVLDALDAASVPYMCVGGLARIVYASPRTTADFDVAVAAYEVPLEEVGRRLGARGVTTTGPTRAEFGNRLVVEGPFEIDLWEGKSPVDRREFGRRNRVRILGRDVWMQSVEDFVLRKLAARRPRDLEDALEVLTFQPDADLDYLREHAGVYRARDLLEEMLSRAAEDRLAAEREDGQRRR